MKTAILHRLKTAFDALKGGKPFIGQLAQTTSTNILSYKQPDTLSWAARRKILKNPYIYSALRNTADELSGKWVGAAGYEPQDETETHLRRPPQILSASTLPLHQTQANHLRWNIDHRLERGWDTVLKQLLRARKHGKSVQEILWQWQTDGPWKKTWVIHDIIDHDADYFNFDMIKKANPVTGVVSYTRRLLYNPSASGIGGYPVPESKFLVFSFDMENENAEGESILTKLDLFDWYQRNNFVFWMTDLNRYGSPLLVGKSPKHATAAQRQALLDAIDSVQQETGIVISEEEVIDILQAQRNGASGFDLLNRILNAVISVVVMGHAGSMEHGQFGTQAEATVTTASIWESLMYALAGQLDSVINRQLIPWFMWFNYPETLEFPRQQILPPRPRPSAPLPPGAPPASPFVHQAPSNQFVVPALAGSSEVPALAGSSFFAAIPETPEDRLVVNSIKQSFDVVATVFQDPVIELIRTAQSPDQINGQLWRLTNTLDITEYTDLFYRACLAAGLLGHFQVWQELGGEAQFSVASDIETLLESPVIVERAKKLLLEKKVIKKRVFERLDDGAKRQAFTIAGVEKDRMMAAIQISVANAIQVGGDLKEIERTAREAFRQYGVTAQVPFHAETVFRTNIQTALNDAKWDAMRDPDVQSQIAYVQYVTMEDTRVRPTHRRMHGVVRPLNDPVWQTWWPPNGFNCRCTVRLITVQAAQAQNIQPTPQLPIARPDDGFSSGPGRWL